jgi:hypothetical protein
MIERLVKDKKKILNKQIFSNFLKKFCTSPLLPDDFFCFWSFLLNFFL